jgi:hypothetical protein
VGLPPDAATFRGRPHAQQRDRVFKQVLVYSGAVIAFGLLLVWLLAFLPF